MSTISRRAFLKTVGVGALSVAAVSVLAGCDTVPGTTGTTTAKTVAGKAGTTYRISDLVSVKTSASTLDDAVGNSYITTYAKAFTDKATEIKKSDASYADYKGFTTEQKNQCKEAAEKAVAKLDNETATVEFVVANYSNAPIFVASASDASNTTGCVFTASCNGTAVKCTVDPIVVVDSNTSSTTITCTIELPVNAETYDVVVTAPNATTVVKYTFKNTSYQDPTKIDLEHLTGWGV